jgi:hypothetical protein
MKYLKPTLIILTGLLLFWTNSGLALISPEHYERIMKERQKDKDHEKKNLQSQDKVQHPELKKGQHPAPVSQGRGR